VVSKAKVSKSIDRVNLDPTKVKNLVDWRRCIGKLEGSPQERYADACEVMRRKLEPLFFNERLSEEKIKNKKAELIEAFLQDNLPHPPRLVVDLYDLLIADGDQQPLYDLNDLILLWARTRHLRKAA
jgi:hypothetical protein